MARNRQVAFLFGRGGQEKDVLGGKGAGLAELAALGMPVPPGFTLTTSLARAWRQHKRLPERLERQLKWNVAALERKTGKTFGSSSGNPLLVSVRSGAPVSMPGMMDTVLNLGLNPEIVAALADVAGKCFAWDCYRRFLSMFGKVVLQVDPWLIDTVTAEFKAAIGADNQQLAGDDLQKICLQLRYWIETETGSPMADDPWEQLRRAVVAVLDSWDNPRAQTYRQANGLPGSTGTAVNVQSMVFGNRDERSGTGVVFSANIKDGEPGLYGEFLANAQGEDVVAGKHSPIPISEMASWAPPVYSRLQALVERLASIRQQVVDVEFTVESGKLYILQVRQAKLSPAAAITQLTRLVWDKKLSRQEAVRQVTPQQLAAVGFSSFNAETVAAAVAANRVVARGLPASPGAAVGVAVHSSDAAVKLAASGGSPVLCLPDTSPDDLPGMLAARAIVTSSGGTSCHAAVVAVELGKPCVVGARWRVRQESDIGSAISVDANTGMIVAGALELSGGVARKEVSIFLRWAGQCRQSCYPQPRLAFEMIDERRDVATMLCDFYLSGQMALSAKGTQLQGVAELAKIKVHTEVAERLALYLVVAVAGELRHAKKSCLTSNQQIKELVDSYALELTDQGGEILSRVQKECLEKLNRMTADKHLRFLQLAHGVFSFADYWRLGYGGPKWAHIAGEALKFLSGETPHSVFADHCFDLQHNTGSVFGKNAMLEVSSNCELERLLQQKKLAAGVYDLKNRFAMTQTAGEPMLPLTEEVSAVFSRGEELGLWAAEAERLRLR